MSRRRSLRPEEHELWHAVARTAKPMHAPVFRRKLAEPEPEPPKKTAHSPHPRLPVFVIGEKAQATSTRPSPEPPIRMDAKAFGKLTRGKLAPEARIDLHGLTLAEAHPDLIRFILNAQSAGLRLVLVITGKGKPGTDHGPTAAYRGVLRQQVPHWLRQPPLGPAILQVTEAHLRHGGSGALYVYLKRGR